MDLNGASLPTSARVQKPSDIRSFFQPRTPQISAPPKSPTTLSIPKLSPNTPPASAALSPSEGVNRPTVTLPPQAAILPVEERHVQSLRRINSLLLSINYPDSFYQQILAPVPTNFSRVITWAEPSSTEGKVVGSIVCRLDRALASESTPEIPKYIDGEHDIYIQSLALLSPYREKGLATAALERVLGAAVSEKELRIAEIYAHVWTENIEALEWYMKRGFKKEKSVVAGYYRKLKPDTAWILRRRITPSDHLANLKSTSLEGTSPSSTLSPGGSERSGRPGVMAHTKSFQDRRPDMEWNDLPEDVLRTNSLMPPGTSANTSANTSRSSSRNGTGAKKKKREYPAAAFGS